MTKVPPVSIAQLELDFSRLERRGVAYGYGIKAPSAAEPQSITKIDCSGYFYWALARATHRELVVPHGSQRQREWAEANLREVDYRQAARHMTQRRLFCAFIRPGRNGCGEVGHVWFLAAFDDGNNGTFAGTLESHGGGGLNSRPWNYPTLLKQVYSCFELPTT